MENRNGNTHFSTGTVDAIQELSRHPESEYPRAGAERSYPVEQGFQEHPNTEAGIRQVRNQSSPIDWHEAWRVLKPVINTWITVFWVLMVMPNALELEGFIEILRELPPIMISFFLIGMIWMFYMLKQDIRMVWFWLVNIGVMFWIY